MGHDGAHHLTIPPSRVTVMTSCGQRTAGMTAREGALDADRTIPSGSSDAGVVELILLMSSVQFAAFEAAAVRRKLTAAQMTRRVLADFLGDPGSP